MCVKFTVRTDVLRDSILWHVVFRLEKDEGRVIPVKMKRLLKGG